MPVGSLRLDGWKGFAGEVPLWPVTMLVGPNGSGKSSLLEALALVSHLARRGTLREDLRPWLRGWPDGVFTRAAAGLGATEATIELRWKKGRYRLSLRNPAAPRIWDEELEVGRRKYVWTDVAGSHRIRKFSGEGAGRALRARDASESALGLYALSPRHRRGAASMLNLMKGIEVYALDADFLRGTAVDSRPIPYARKGPGLVSGLIDAARDPALFAALESAVRAVQPDLSKIEVRQRPRGILLRYSDGRETQLDEESDGLVRAAGMFLVRYRRDAPGILGFDEPENGFHLSRLVEVVERLAPTGRQGLPSPELLFLATHSPETRATCSAVAQEPDGGRHAVASERWPCSDRHLAGRTTPRTGELRPAPVRGVRGALMASDQFLLALCEDGIERDARLIRALLTLLGKTNLKIIPLEGETLHRKSARLVERTFSQRNSERFDLLLHRDADESSVHERRAAVDAWFQQHRLQRFVDRIVCCIPAPCTERWLCFGIEEQLPRRARVTVNPCDPWRKRWEAAPGPEWKLIETASTELVRRGRSLDDFRLFLDDLALTSSSRGP